MQASTQADQETPANSFFRVRRSPTVMKVVSTGALLIAGVLLVAPFYLSKSATTPDGKRVWRVIETHDLRNHFRFMEAFDRSLKSGVIQPRWLADVNNGYGSATFDFYPRSFYYLSSFTNLAVNNWMLTLFIISALAVAGSGLAFYKLSRVFYGKQASAIAATVYILLPIHLLDLYWRGAITQFVGYVFMPLDLYFAYKVGSEGRARHYAGLGFLYGCHLLMNLPVGYMITYTLAAYAVLWSVKAKDWRIGLRIGCGLAIGLLLSATYWLPAAVHTKDTFELDSQLMPYHYTYITPQPSRDAFETLVQGAFYFGIIVLIIAMVILRRPAQRPAEETPTAISTGSGPERSAVAQFHTRLWVILCAVTIFLTTSYSYYISVLIPRIQIAGPPFRWLAISSLFIALLVAACVDQLKSSVELQRRKAWAYGFVLFAALAVNVWVSLSGTVSGAISLLHAYEPPPNIAAVINDGFIPKGATSAAKLADTPLVVAQPEGAAIEIGRWDPEDRLILVNASVPTSLRLKTYNYPGWTAEIDGKPAQLLSDPDGVQLVDVEPGIHRVKVAFVNTFARNVGDSISIVALFVILGLTLIGVLKNRKERVLTAEADYELASSGTVGLSRQRNVSLGLSRRWILILAIAGAAVALFLVMQRLNSGSESKSADNAPQLSVNGAQKYGSNDSEARLYLPGRDSIPVAVDEQAFDELVQALASASRDIAPLVSSSRVFLVPNNTKVRILGASSARTRIRIVEGNQIMAEGVVSERWVR